MDVVFMAQSLKGLFPHFSQRSAARLVPGQKQYASELKAGAYRRWRLHERGRSPQRSSWHRTQFIGSRRPKDIRQEGACFVFVLVAVSMFGAPVSLCFAVTRVWYHALGFIQVSDARLPTKEFPVDWNSAKCLAARAEESVARSRQPRFFRESGRDRGGWRLEGDSARGLGSEPGFRYRAFFLRIPRKGPRA